MFWAPKLTQQSEIISDPLGEVPAAMLDQPLPKFRSDDQLTIVVAGSDAGMFSAIIGGWVSGELGSQMVTRKITLEGRPT